MPAPSSGSPLDNIFNASEAISNADHDEAVIIHVPRTETFVEIHLWPYSIDFQVLERLLMIEVRLDITRRSLPDRGGQEIDYPYVRHTENDKFTAIRLSSQRLSWDTLYETTTGLKMYMLDQRNHNVATFFIRHRGHRVGWGTIKPRSSVSTPATE